uniref:Uncharacterized protein n=1 Tax=Chenopodium quinoa TaxID=63459 RepID=A0A803MY98_CHEQI
MVVGVGAGAGIVGSRGWLGWGRRRRTEPEGVKWGEYWANGAADDTTARKWVVAFDTTAGKAYIEAGPMGPVDWNVVEVKLIMSRCISKHTYPILGGNVLAAIDGFKAYAEFR